MIYSSNLPVTHSLNPDMHDARSSRSSFGRNHATTTTTTKKHLRGCLVTHSFISSMYQPEYQCWCAGAQIQLEQLAVLLKRAQKLELAQPGWCRDEVFFCLFGGGFRAIMAFCMNNVPLCHLCPPPTPK